MGNALTAGVSAYVWRNLELRLSRACGPVDVGRIRWSSDSGCRYQIVANCVPAILATAVAVAAAAPTPGFRSGSGQARELGRNQRHFQSLVGGNYQVTFEDNCFRSRIHVS